jgi:signal transduction histidine kinase
MTPVLAVGTVRWSGALGGGIGLTIGILQTLSVQRAIEADRAKREQRQIERERDRLEEFATTVSHDLRSPLNVAQGHLQMLEGDVEHPRIDKIAAALDRIDPIIDNTLTLARAGLTVGETDTVDLPTIAEASWNSVAADDVILRIDGEATLEADEGRLQQVLENLFRNAIEHADGVETVCLGVLDDESGFYVEDDGAGIPNSEREDVFQSGYSGSRVGTGFGLSIVERIVDAHGWSITLTEGTAGGARFEITGVDIDRSGAAGKTPTPILT